MVRPHTIRALSAHVRVHADEDLGSQPRLRLRFLAALHAQFLTRVSAWHCRHAQVFYWRHKPPNIHRVLIVMRFSSACRPNNTR